MKSTIYHHPSILPTSDGSSTLVHSFLDELYHSRHGAWTESQHIYIAHGLTPVIEKYPPSIHVFEMGFGSGLNATLTREVADQYQVPVRYTTVENFPVDHDIVAGMDMPEQSREERKHWLELHQVPWEAESKVSSYFYLHKIRASFSEVVIPDMESFDLIYYDAFAPAAQPELWTVASLAKCYDMLTWGGLWLSYCAKGQVRRNLKEAGFEVEALPGPPGKREITMAMKNNLNSESQNK